MGTRSATLLFHLLEKKKKHRNHGTEVTSLSVPKAPGSFLAGKGVSEPGEQVHEGHEVPQLSAPQGCAGIIPPSERGTAKPRDPPALSSGRK